MATLLVPLNSLLLMHLWGGGSSLWWGYLTRDKHFKSTTLKRECKGDQRHLDIWLFFFFFLKKKESTHLSYAVRPFELLQSGLHSQVWCPWHTGSALSYTQNSVEARALSKGTFLELERGLNYSLKWHFQHLKPWQVGDLSSPLASLPVLSVVSHYSLPALSP